ncbi:hypothetical protein [Rhodoferax sp.]|uniref:hypothetical protein n=1 Tax=Rhodoferax sp. TaxID=50421 RepID=UPI0026389EED|nr:hypothetical protein [Rhodoferax sp.]MDD2807994.1 hypothetical protein [Rhodoferax sp.]MDD4942027.1 hypothetical protein [Rhodoferax sp.]MDD5478551.1 hypothetical protein [Rhodoferax sp.]
MQAFYAERFDREMACTEADWLRWLPAAVGDRHWKLQTGTAGVRIDDGALGLKWQVAAPRVIGLVRMPVLRVSFRFAGLDDAQRYTFMKRFDLYMQRGGG